MAERNCQSCADLQNDAPNLIVNGITTTEKTSLANNTGLNPSSGNDDCTDLNNLNDCLIGNMEEEIEAYDVCDWKDYTKNLVNNIWTVFAGVIAAICGLWTTLTNLQNTVARLNCIVNKMQSAETLRIDRNHIVYDSDWIEFRTGGSDAPPAITGNAYAGYMTGSITIKEGASGLWSKVSSGGNLIVGGYLLYEYRVKKSDFDIIRFWNTDMDEVGTGVGINAHVFTFDEGEKPWAYEGNDERGDTVPSGYVYLQIRLMSVVDWGRASSAPHDVSLCGIIPYLKNLSKEC